MRFTVCVTLLLLAATSRAEFGKKENSFKTEKRALTEGNAGLKKRAPVLPTVSSSVNAGIEYANTKQALTDKSPSQREYSAPFPQIAKISDLLAGQGPSFQAAIANQLYAPVSVYQPRSGIPTTYEVSAPVPSQLAYSEHRLAYQQPNDIQYTPKVYTTKLSRQQDYSQQQQILAQPQQIYNQQQQIQQIYQQDPQVNYQQQTLEYNQVQPVQYSAQQLKQLKQLENQQVLYQQYQQSPQTIYQDNQQNQLQNQYNPAPQTYYTEGQQQYQQQYEQPAYVRDQPIQNVQFLQPGFSYSRPEETQQKLFSQPEQNRVYEKQQLVAQNYQPQSQGAVSFASLSHSQPAPSIIHHPFQQQSIQQTQQYTAQESSNIASQGNADHERQPSYFKQGLQFQIQPQVLQSQVQAQVYQQAQPQVQYLAKTAGYKAQPVASAPAYPAVQYFGKYAQSIFGKSQH